MAAPIHEATRSYVWGNFEPTSNSVKQFIFKVKQLKYQIPIAVNRLETDKLHFGRPESHVSDDDIKEIRRTVSHKSEWDDLFHIEHISSDEDENLIKQIEHFYERNETFSVKVIERLAKLVNDGFFIRINDDKKTDLLAKH